jgi:hypothetical protein
MQVVSFPARQARTHYRHELRTLTYVTLDAANGGIIRNLNSKGVAVQAVAALRHQQRVRVRFELKLPRLRVETYGLVSWASASGQCGISFLDLPAKTGRQIDEWIFSNLLESMSRHAGDSISIFGSASPSIAPDHAEDENDGLILSAQPRPVIQPDLPRRGRVQEDRYADSVLLSPRAEGVELNWLSRPLSARTLARLIDGLVLVAGLLLFVLVFLSITHELPPWPFTLGAASSAAVFVATAYWVLFALFGGASLGTRLAQSALGLEEEEEKENAIRIR